MKFSGHLVLQFCAASVLVHSVGMGFADAQTSPKNYYVTLSGLYGIIEDTKTQETGRPVLARGSFSFDKPVGGAIAFGYRFAKGFKLETEISYRKSDIKSFEGEVTFSGPGSFPIPITDRTRRATLEGKLATATFMANVYYEHRLDILKPYAGIGIGVATHDSEVKTDYNIVTVPGGFGRGTRELSFSRDAFAFQILVGLAVEFNDQIELRAGYRYLNTGDVEWAPGGEFLYAAHTGEVGVSWSW